MANPQYPVNVTADQYTKVATNVTTGLIHRMKNSPSYKQTYRLTGEAAPTLESESVSMFINNEPVEEISSSEPIDVYIWPDEDGILRVDV